MPYLICEKCGGYYQLQPGESPEDFSNKCQCSGTLHYSENFQKSSQKTLNCSKCGLEVEEKVKVCPECGEKIKTEKKGFSKLINWRSVIFGVIILLILQYVSHLILQILHLNNITINLTEYFLIFFIGLYVGYKVNKNIESGLINTTLYGLIYCLYSLIGLLIFQYSNLEVLVSLMIILILSWAGGIVGNLITRIK